MDFPGGIWPVSLDATPVPRTKDQVASLRFVTPGFFRAMEIPLRRGRDVDARDRRDDPAVAVVSESFARRYWPGADPLGQRFQVAFAERTVVGVAADIRVRGVERESEPQVYLPATQVADSAIYWYAPKELVVRASGDQAALVTAVRRMVRQADPDQPVSNVRTLEEIVSGQTASRAVQARLLGLFAALALLLAGVGIHGLLSYSVSSRAQEIGVRMALGAAPRDVVSMVVGQGVRLAAAGVLPGLALAYAAGRTLESLLASVKPGDGVTFLVVAGVCLAMTTAGCLVPAIRAARLDPMAAIRAD
jgi:predicted permease